MTTEFKCAAANRRVKTHENTKSPEGATWTLTSSDAVGLVVTESDSRRRGVLGRRSQSPSQNVNNGGRHEQ